MTTGDGAMRSYVLTNARGEKIGFGCGHCGRPPTSGDLAIVREFAATLRYEPVPCRCPHGEDWHSAGGCEARGCPCEVEPR